MVTAGAHGQEHHTSIWPFLVAVATGLSFGGLVIPLALTAFRVGLLRFAVGGGLPAAAPVPTWAAPGAILNVHLTALNTFILILSSFTMVEALKSAERGNQAAMKGFLLATFLLGATFVSIQAYEYQKLYLSEGLRPWGIDPALWAERSGGALAPLWGQTFGSTFYVQTGFHGAHVSGGVLALGFLTAKAFKGRYSAKNHEAIELVGLYWHFVDVA